MCFEEFLRGLGFGWIRNGWKFGYRVVVFQVLQVQMIIFISLRVLVFFWRKKLIFRVWIFIDDDDRFVYFLIIFQWSLIMNIEFLMFLGLLVFVFFIWVGFIFQFFRVIFSSFYYFNIKFSGRDSVFFLYFKLKFWY